MEPEREFEYVEGHELGYYVEVMLRRWYVIVLPAVLLAVLAAAILSLMPDRYQAKALVYDVSLASDNTNPGARPEAPDLTAYSELVHNPALATAVLDRIGDSLSADEREPYALLSIVDARIVSSGSQIEIEATYGDPAVALGIADAWALESIDQINGIYRQSVDESLQRVQKELDAASTEYFDRQTELEDLIAQDQQSELNQRIIEITGMTRAIGQARVQRVAALFEELRWTESMLRAAIDLAEQVRTGGTAAADSGAIALAALKLQVFGQTLDYQVSGQTRDYENATLQRSQAPIVQLQPGAERASAADLIADAGSLAVILQGRLQALLDAIASGSSEVRQGEPWALLPSDPIDPVITAADPVNTGIVQTQAELEAQLRDLEGALEHERAVVEQATLERDLALEAYSALLRQASELQRAQDTGGLELSLGVASAVHAVEKGVLRNALLAGIAGVMLGLGAAFGMEYWESYRARSEAQ